MFFFGKFLFNRINTSSSTACYTINIYPYSYSPTRVRNLPESSIPFLNSSKWLGRCSLALSIKKYGIGAQPADPHARNMTMDNFMKLYLFIISPHG